MRGLITVKLANEQVNYRTKFLKKNCHFSERCNRSCSKSLKEKGGGGGSRGRMSLYPFSFLARFSSEAHCLRLRGNGCINELLFCFRGHFFPFAFSLPLSPSSFPSLRRAHQTPLQRSTHSPAHHLSSFTSQEPLGGFRFLICYNHVEKEFLGHGLKFARTFRFTQIVKNVKWRKR